MATAKMFFLRFLGGLIFAFSWSVFSVLTGIYNPGQSSALYTFGILGFFLLGSWTAKTLLNRHTPKSIPPSPNHAE